MGPNIVIEKRLENTLRKLSDCKNCSISELIKKEWETCDELPDGYDMEIQTKCLCGRRINYAKRYVYNSVKDKYYQIGPDCNEKIEKSINNCSIQ